MLSIIITAYKEENTIALAIKNLLLKEYSGLGLGKIDKDWEFILVSPDQPTQSIALKALTELNIPKNKYTILTDEKKGKPTALNMCFKIAKGDYFLITDGDVAFGKYALKYLVEELDLNLDLMGITGRPIAKEPKTNMLNYFGALLADAAHHKRIIDLTADPKGYSTRFVKKRGFFPLSGYIMVVKNIKWELPTDVLVDDAYMSYLLHNKGYRLGYVANAIVEVKYATTLSDYFKQKKRSVGGYLQLWKYGIVSNTTKTRTFWRELEYFWFPIKYATNFKELIWSLNLYPVRLWLWLKIFWERKILNKDFTATWVRIESTK